MGYASARPLPAPPVLSDRVPVGPEWIHELKHDGWRMIARRSGEQVRLWLRNPILATATAAHSLLYDGLVFDGQAGDAPRVRHARVPGPRTSGGSLISSLVRKHYGLGAKR
jgi:hypothetical protein